MRVLAERYARNLDVHGAVKISSDGGDVIYNPLYQVSRKVYLCLTRLEMELGIEPLRRIWIKEYSHNCQQL